MSNKVLIPFEVDYSTNIPFTEMNPDIQFYWSTP